MRGSRKGTLTFHGVRIQIASQDPDSVFLPPSSGHRTLLFMAFPLGHKGPHHASSVLAPGRRELFQGFWRLQIAATREARSVSEATLAGTRKDYLAELAAVPLLIIDDLGMRKLAHTAAEDLLELIMRRYERASTLLTSNRPVDDWGKLLGDTTAVTPLLDRLLHHAHVLKCGPRSWRTKVHTDLQSGENVR
jgi:IstB-like ATP binding protein